MKRGISLLILILFAFAARPAAPTGAAAPEDPLARVLKREGYTVSLDLKMRKKRRAPVERFVDLLAEDGPNAYATGFVVGDGLVMTAYHVTSGELSPGKRRQLGFSPHDRIEVAAYINGCAARVLRVDAEADLALLGGCETKGPVGKLAFQTAPAEDEQMLVIARPNGTKAVRRGSFSGPYVYHGLEYWSARIEGRDGFSGSPVYNEKGEFVGVFSGYDSVRKVAVISPGTKAQKLLQDYLSDHGR